MNTTNIFESILKECKQKTYENMTAAQVRDDIESEISVYFDTILDRLVDSVMEDIDTDGLKREFIYTFYDSVSDTDIDVEADGFEEASYIMFSDSEYDPATCELMVTKPNT